MQFLELLRAMSEKRTIRFIVAGGMSALFFLAICYLLLFWGLPPFSATILAYACSFVVGFVSQKQWAFRFKGPGHVALVRYLVLQLGCAVFSGFLADLLSRAGIAHLPVAIMITVIAALISYQVSSRWVFNESKSTK